MSLMKYWSNGRDIYEIADGSCREDLTNEATRAKSSEKRITMETIAVEKFLAKMHPGYSVGEIKTDSTAAIAF